MTIFGSKDSRGGEAPPGEKHFEVKDRRRLDPTTGAVREPAAPGSAAADPGNPANATQPVSATVTANSDEFAAAKQEAAERTADLQRITAEYANYRKRVERDKQQASTLGKAVVVGELLAVLDDLDRAEVHGDLTGGFKTVADKLTGILQRLGLSHFGAVGDEFDPNVHEAVQHATSPQVTHPTVTAVLRAGYHFGERLLRPAVVAVTGPEEEPAAAVVAEAEAAPARTGVTPESTETAAAGGGAAQPGDGAATAGGGPSDGAASDEG